MPAPFEPHPPEESEDARTRRRRGRPAGSKNKPKSAEDRVTAADLLGRMQGARPHEELFVDEVGPEAIASDTELARILREKADFKRFGTGARSPLLFVQDVSPSEIAHEAEWLAGAPEVAKELAKSAVARNLVDVIHIAAAESAEVLSFAHGDFPFPPSIRYGRGTSCIPWMEKVKEIVETYEGALKDHGIALREGLVVFASDFRFNDFDPAALRQFKDHCRRKRLVALAAMFGDADEHIAAEFSAPLAPVDLNAVPLGIFIRELTKTATRSFARPGALEEMMARAISGLIEPRGE
jgi:hypothetical protein